MTGAAAMPHRLYDPPLPRRILMTADTVGGVWNYTLELVRGLTLQGIEVALATMGRIPSAEQRRAAGRIPGLALHPSSYRLEWMDDPWEDLERGGEWLLSLEEKIRPDLVHLNGYVHGALPWNSPCLVVAHSCVLSWWHGVRRNSPPLRFDRYRDGVARGLACAGLVAAPTTSMLRSLEQHYLPLPQGRVIYNGRSTRNFRPGKKEAVILTVGRIWDEAKNIGAVAKIAESLPWPVCVAGEEFHPGGGSPLAGSVIRLGQLPAAQLAKWFSAASIYTLPARYEPFGLTILEAAMSGCALVIGDIPSLRELWDGAALFVPPDDTAALADALQQLCADRALREELAGKALKRSRVFTAEKMIAQYCAAYLSLQRSAATGAKGAEKTGGAVSSAF